MAQSGLSLSTKSKQATEVSVATTHKTSTQVASQSGLSASTSSIQTIELAKARAALLSNQQ